MVRYPYILWVFQPGEAEQLPNGDWLPGEPGWVPVRSCRDESTSAGATVTLEDGTVQVVNTVVYLPPTTSPVAVGSSVEIRQAGQTRTRGTVKRFEKGQLHARLWL